MGSMHYNSSSSSSRYYEQTQTNNQYNGASSSTAPNTYRSTSFMDGISEPPAPLTSDPNFDIIDWSVAYQSCQRYFLDHAQHEPGTQALCALVNIRLPFQSTKNPILSSAPSSGPPSAASNTHFNFGGYARASSSSLNSPNRSRNNNGSSSQSAPPTFVSLIPYIRRLIITGFDKPPILHGFFGDDYPRGILPHLDCERRNYLFAAKHGGWRTCKKQYDSGSGGGDDETVPFMKPLEEARIEEIAAAEKAWSAWLAMEDWMVGPRAPGEGRAEREEDGAAQENIPDGVGEFNRRC